MLEKMLEMQRQLQEKHYGAAPDTLEGQERVQFVKDMHIALTDELHEALAEVSWKPWAKAEYFNEAAFKGELVDAFHFFMNLMMAGHISADDLYEGYVKKNKINAQRQIDGYDGVSTKCQGCGRALDDEAVKCEETYCAKYLVTFYPKGVQGAVPDAMALDEGLDPIQYMQLPRPKNGTVDGEYYRDQIREIMEAQPKISRDEAKKQLFSESYGKPPLVQDGEGIKKINEATESVFDKVKPMRRSGRINEPSPAINMVVNPLPELTLEQLQTRINRTARSMPNLFDRRNIL